MNNYFAQYLTSPRSGSLIQHEIPISPKDYEKLNEANKCFELVETVTAFFESLKENYHEYEAYKFRACHKHILYEKRAEYDRTKEDIRTLNRLLLNVLNSCLFYVDATKKHLQKTNKSSFTEQEEALRKDSSHYKVMRALRNYATHRGMIVDNIQYLTNLDVVRDDNGNLKPNYYEYNLYVWFDTKNYFPDARNKDSGILEVMANISDKLGFLDITSSLRHYINELYILHHTLLETLFFDFSKYQDIYRETLTTVVGKENYYKGNFVRVYDGKPREDRANALLFLRCDRDNESNINVDTNPFEWCPLPKTYLEPRFIPRSSK